MVLRGFAEQIFRQHKKPIHFFYSNTDHAAVIDLVEELRYQGHYTHEMSVDSQGEFSLNSLLSWMQEKINLSPSSPILLNYTYVNNETGVFWPLEYASDIKKRTGCHVHVDAVQSAGKIENFQKILPTLEAYTFSGHKFGALKGVGFTFLQKGFSFVPLIKGGGQQKGKRSGTENVMGVYSLKLAMEELCQNFDFHEMQKSKLWLESELKRLLGDKGLIVAEDAKNRNGNTITFVLKQGKTDLVQAALDLAGIEVSGGSACSSGSLTPNRILKSMGFEESLCRGMIRLSFSPFLKMQEAKEYFEVLKTVLLKFLN